MMKTARYDGNDFSSMVLSTVKSIFHKRNINYVLDSNSNSNNNSYLYDSDDNLTLLNDINNHSEYLNNELNANNSLPNGRNEDINNYWALLALILVFGTAGGNILVCLAIAWEKRLQNVTNYFLASLALTDLMVAVLVMPLGIVTLFRGKVLLLLIQFTLIITYLHTTNY